MGKILKSINIGDKINSCVVIELIYGNTSKTRKWKVRCNCGAEYIQREETLKHQNPKICICNKYVNLIGNTINNFIIKDFDVKNKKYFIECKCGKQSYKSKFQIYNTNSCGCLHELDLTGKIYERLTFIKKIDKKWEVKCNCGNVRYYYGKTFGKIKSCGCLGKEKAKSTIKFAIKASYKDEFCALRKRFKSNYSDGDLVFEDFYKMSQENCYYCNSKPSNLCKRTSINFGKDIYYNGLDRINNNLGHYKNNIVPCCIICNRAKANRNLNEFICWAKNIKKNEIDYKIENYDINKFSKLLKNYKENYSNGLSFNEFVSLSQMNCHYCSSGPINKKGDLLWNGVDRIDSNLDHTLSNCVPCCKICNFAKSNLNINDFYNHINKIKNNVIINNIA